MDTQEIKNVIKEKYGAIAQTGGRAAQSCCGTVDHTYSHSVGYSEEELKNAPNESNLSLGCGNPTSIASLKEGETVLDLGSGAGFDCFLAASKVGPHGRVIGVDMTPEMVEKAQENARKNKIDNVDFRLGDIEKLPVDSDTADVIISNCVINLSTDKQRAYDEAYRVLKPGGRLAISDIALKEELPEKIRNSIKAYVGCIAGAELIDDYKRIVEASGFQDVRIQIKTSSSCGSPHSKDPLVKAVLESIGEGESLLDKVASIYVEGHK